MGDSVRKYHGVGAHGLAGRSLLWQLNAESRKANEICKIFGACKGPMLGKQG